MDDLECPVCLDIKRFVPYVACIAGHSICGPCQQKVKNTCPICRGGYNNPPTRIRFIENFIATDVNLVLPCMNVGCKINAKKVTRDKHEANCVYRRVNCPKMCGGSIRQRNLANHIRIKHNPCLNQPDCEITGNAQVMNKHMLTCPQQKVEECVFQCGGSFKRIDMNKHLQNMHKECSNKGCDFIGTPKGCKAHADTCKYYVSPCLFTGCQVDLRRMDVLVHDQAKHVKCSNRLDTDMFKRTANQMCDFNGEPAAVTKHASDCEFRLVQCCNSHCMACSAVYSRRICGHTTVQSICEECKTHWKCCTHVGCEHYVPVNEIDNHIEEKHKETCICSFYMHGYWFFYNIKQKGWYSTQIDFVMVGHKFKQTVCFNSMTNLHYVWVIVMGSKETAAKFQAKFRIYNYNDKENVCHSAFSNVRSVDETREEIMADEDTIRLTESSIKKLLVAPIAPSLINLKHFGYEHGLVITFEINRK